ncbi:MAG: AsmA family protein [Proteobacteria bacterium]|nr:AsmA family protein [Pseudomonadota bacterium]
MTSSRRNRLLIAAAGVVGVLIVALLIAPSLIDLDRYKPQIVAEVKKATGRDLVIDGPASLSLLPLPSATVSGVKFFNMPGAKNPNMVEVKSITVKPSVLALLVGRLAVDEVTLVEPKIVLEINAEGKPNWEFAPSVAEAKPAAPKPSSPMPLSLGRLAIENGTLIFSDSKAGLSVTAEKANFEASVGSIDGPYSLAGSAMVNGAPLKLDLSVGAKGGDGMATSIALEAGGGKLSFNGKLSELGPNARLVGQASASADSLTAFAATLIGLAGQPVPALPPLLASKFSFDGAIEASQSQFAARDFKLALAGDSGSGSIAVTLKPALAVDARLSLPRIDLDRVLAGLSAPPPPATPGKPASAATPTSSGGASFLETLTAKISLDAAEVVYNKQSVRKVAIELDAKGGAVAVPRLAATLPGDMVLQAQSTLSGRAVSGDFSLVGPKLRDTLAWLAIDTSSLPPNKLTRLSLKGQLGSSGGAVQVKNAAFELDDVKGTGGVTITFSVPLSIVTQIDIDSVDLDSYLAKPAGGDKKPAAPAPAAAPGSKPPTSVGPSIGLKLKIARAIYNKQAIGGIQANLALKGRTVSFDDISVSNLGGARLAVRGNVTDFDQPSRRFDVAFNFEAPDLAPVLRIAGATAPDTFGKVAAKGGVSGSVEAMTFRELEIAAEGQTARIDGTLTMPGAATRPPSTIGYKGKVTANGQTIEGTVEAKVADRPEIKADLRTSLLDLDKFGSAPAPTQRGKPAAPAQPATQTIDTAPLRAFDASFKLVAGTLISSPLRLNNADIALTLKDGLLTLQHLKGGLYGGAVDLSGTIDGRKPALAIDFKGDARGINLAEMLRSTSGTNVFGGKVRVTVDGQLNATGITLKGAGTTREQLRGSMVGGLQLSGHVFAGADQALITLGTGAANAVGGVVDNTLGNVLGVVGARSPTNLLTAASVLLNRFVNRNNPISGHLDIAGGMVSDKSLVVSGDRATANIATRTNLVTRTTNTTVNFVLAEDPSAPYIIASINGPLSGPSYSVSRGSAKDPPGVVNTLTNAVPNIVPGVGNVLPKVPLPNLPLPNLFGR